MHYLLRSTYIFCKLAISHDSNRIIDIQRSIFFPSIIHISFHYMTCDISYVIPSLAMDDCYSRLLCPRHGRQCTRRSPARTYCGPLRPFLWFISALYSDNEMLSLTACGTSCQPLLGDEVASRLTLPYAASATCNTLLYTTQRPAKALVYRHYLRPHAISLDCGSGMHYWLNTIVELVRVRLANYSRIGRTARSDSSYRCDNNSRYIIVARVKSSSKTVNHEPTVALSCWLLSRN